MKKTFFKSLAGIAAVAFAVSCTAPGTRPMQRQILRSTDGVVKS